MAYNNFSLQEAISKFDLNLTESAFCEALPPVSPKPEFLNIFEQYLPLAQKAKSEKAKSELLVSPILVELLRLADNQIQLFSGEEFNVDSPTGTLRERERGLNGFCDFLLSKSTISSIIQAPIVMLVEAKKGELDVGLGQCTAEMVAAQIFNANEDKPIPVVYGCVTSGKLWQFLKLENQDLTSLQRRGFANDLNEYQVTPVERILGILKWMVSG
jgi:hypothetical protein